MKFKEWFSVKEIKNEAKKVSWLTKKDLAKNASTVLLFCLTMGVFFYAGDAIIALILKALGTN